MNRFSALYSAPLLFAVALFMTGCGSGSKGSGGTTPNPATPKVAVTPASGSVTTAQSLGVIVAVSGTGGIATGSVILTSGGYTSSATTLSSDSASITVPAGSLAAGTDTLTAKYTPDSASLATYTSGSGTGTVTVTVPPAIPTVTVTPVSSSVTTTQSLGVTVAVSGGNGIASGSVVVSSGSYTSSTTVLSAGSASITIPANSLGVGSDTLTAKYTPDTASSTLYTSGSGTASVSVTQPPNTTNVTVNINALANRHAISPFVYGGNYNSAATIADSGTTLARWGGNASSTYNWQLQTYNADNDYYFEDFDSGGNGAQGDSVQFLTDVQTAGSHALTTMPMLGWVAQSAEDGKNGHWSYSVATYGKQCSIDQYNTDAGDGLETDCQTPVTTAAVTKAYFPLLDTSSDSCPSGDCVYREPWAQALGKAFGTGTCAVPYTTITSCHFYDMDNEIDIWGGTHRDVHPAPSGYEELANDFETEATGLKTWDPAAVRFGPVTCCWYFYWASASGTDRADHAGIDYLPWWLNQIKWLDQINGARTLDVFDIHAYAEGNTTGLSNEQLQALSASVYRDYWDPTYVSTAGDITQPYTTSVEPNYPTPFRIPRMKALVNAIYPGTPLSFTEWSAAFYKEADFSTALGDAEAYGIFGREGMAFATRFYSPVKGNPNYQALKMYTNYDGAHHGFGTVSVSDLNTGDPSLFSSYAALNSTGTAMTIMMLNEDPTNTAQVTFNLKGFTPTTYTAYTMSLTASAISSATSWAATQSFAPYSITLLVVNGSQATTPVTEWYLNPDDLMVPATTTATLHPAIFSGSSNVTLSSAAFDAYEGAPACTGGSLSLGTATITPAQPATLNMTAGSTTGFCHFTVTGSDGTATQTQGGWIVVGNPPGMLSQGGNSQSGTAGTALANPLTVTLSPGQSGSTANGAGILFTTTAGTLSNGTVSGTSVIAVTDASGIASVTLTLPSSPGTVTVTAQDQFALGGTSVVFTEAAK